MKLKVFTLRFSGSTEGFDDKPLRDFIADKEVIEFSEHFFTIDLDLEKLRVLLRICHDLRYLDGKGYEFASRQINEAGKMIGGWRKQQETREP